jgi:hypothetical protein
MEYIHEERNVLSKTFCRELIDKFESDSRKKKGTSTSNGVVNHVDKLKKCTDLEICRYDDWMVECKRIDKAFHTAFRNYQNNLKLNVFGEDKANIVDYIFNNPNTIKSGFLMGRYGVGGHFNWHIDYFPFEECICNFIIYLNDHETCTEFLNGKKIKPEAGKVTFFPSTWTYGHCSQPVEEDNKYIITCFIFKEKELTQSLPFIVRDD